MNMFFDNGHMVSTHGFWWLFWLALIAAVLFAVWGRSGRSGRSRHASPHEILQRRLASGEITSQDYEERKRLLDRDGSASP
jgi:putative membrane protein